DHTRTKKLARGLTHGKSRRGGTDLSRKTSALFSALFGVLLIAALAFAGGAGAKTETSKAGSLTGAGSSFVSKLVQAWIPKVNSQFGIKVTYGPIGSGGGINTINNRAGGFGPTQRRLSPA